MPFYLNKLEIAGNVGSEIELVSTKTGVAKAMFSVATQDSRKDKTTGEWIENTIWHRCIAFNKTAEYLAEGYAKGDNIYIEGKQVNRSYESDDGKKNYVSEVIINRAKKIPRAPKAEAGDGQDFDKF